MTLQIFKAGGLFDLKLIYAFFRAARDGQYSVKIERVRRAKSNDQLGYLWGCVYPLVLDGLLDAGWDDFTDVEQVHEYCKATFAKQQIVNYQTGEVIEFPHSTALMNTMQMLTYTDAIRKWAREYLSTEIPDPDPAWKGGAHGKP